MKTNDRYKPEIKLFFTGRECLDNLDSQPDIIILDYYLFHNGENAANGIEVLKRIKKINPEANVIMLSAQDKIEVAVNSIKYGAYDYVIKNESAFSRTNHIINNILHTARLRKEARAYKFGSIAAISFILTLVLSIIVLSILFPTVFKMGALF